MSKTPAPAAAPSQKFHPRNRHPGRYDFAALVAGTPELAAFVAPNAYGNESVDFANPDAVRALNRALLKLQYGVTDWNLPPAYLCPPIPGRADVLHYLADLLADGGPVPTGPSVRVLDIGVGANCIYPLIGHSEYGWSFVGTDIDETALACARKTLDANPGYREAIELRYQDSPLSVFQDVLGRDELFDLSLCNPPFHASRHDARAGTERKWQNLGKDLDRGKAPVLNFGGQDAELCCEGGEEGFITRMINESRLFPGHAMWFTTLVSKAASLPAVHRALSNIRVQDSRTIDMAQGQKKSRIVAWTFLNERQRQARRVKGER